MIKFDPIHQNMFLFQTWLKLVSDPGDDDFGIFLLFSHYLPLENDLAICKSNILIEYHFVIRMVGVKFRLN